MNAHAHRDDTRATLDRRALLAGGAALASACVAGRLAAAEPPEPMMIVDTHQHLWDLDRFRLPWLEEAPEVLRRSYLTDDYRAATGGRATRAVYMEVDVDPRQHVAEAEHVVSLCRDDAHPTEAAVVGGRPASSDFGDYVRRLKTFPEIRGVRQVLHGATTPPGHCLSPAFQRGVRLLGEHDLMFDLCMRPRELADGRKLAALCPDTRFMLDHCGNADVNAFGRSDDDAQPWHEPDAWRRDIDALAALPHVNCKISGVIARARPGWTADDLAPIVNHCLDAFGPDRVVFGGDWPVCLLGAPLASWIDALLAIIASRPAADQEKLLSGNARRIYRLA